MPVTVIALLSLNEEDPHALGQYFAVTQPLLDRAGAKIVKRFEIKDLVAGRQLAKMAVIVEYPDRAAVDSVFESDEYKSILPIRDRAFHEYSISIGASEPDAELEKVGSD